MGLSKRERMIFLITVLAVAALVGEYFIRAPLAARWGETQGERRQLATQVKEAKNLFARRQQMERKHQTLLKEGLRSDAEAESRVAKALEKWSEDARLTLSSVKPDRLAGDKGLKEIIFVVAGKGSLDSVAWFLYQVETSELPVKVKYMQLGSTSESGDSMSVELRLSTLYVAAAEKSSTPTRGGAAGRQAQPKQKEAKNDELLL